MGKLNLGAETISPQSRGNAPTRTMPVNLGTSLSLPVSPLICLAPGKCLILHRCSRVIDALSLFSPFFKGAQH